MKNGIKKGFFLTALTVLALSAGCRKKKDTIAVIYVRDVNNELVSGATVKLYGESTTNKPSTLSMSSTTNTSGEATFNLNDVYQLGQAGVAVLNIDASKDDASGEGIIKVEQETTSDETVFIQP